MELDTEMDLNEVAGLLGMTGEKLIRLAANGKLAITVLADDWPIRTEDGAVGSITGPANLVPKDLEQSFNADFTLVREVATLDDGEILTLHEPIELRRGRLFIDAKEYRRFRDKYGNAASRSEDVPAHLDADHDWHSTQLMIAIEAWTALFANGDFDAKGKAVKQHIEIWLSKNGGKLSENTRESIATLINPDIYKKGGVPPTPVK